MPLGIPHSAFLAWPEVDQAKALAYQRWQREKCSRCGTRAKDWERDPDAFMSWSELCKGCERLDQEQSHAETEKKLSPARKFFLVTREHGRRLVAEMAKRDRPRPRRDDGPGAGSTLA